MATVTKKICDRCGKQIEYVGWTANLENVFKRGKRIKIYTVFDGNPDGYSYSDRCYELCADCTEQLKCFLWQTDKEKYTIGQVVRAIVQPDDKTADKMADAIIHKDSELLENLIRGFLQ